MKLFFKFCSPLLIVSLFVGLSASLASHIYTGHALDESNLLTSDIQGLLASLSEMKALSLQLLYDTTYEGTISVGAIAKHLSFQPSGLMLHLYNGSRAILERIIGPGKDRTLLLVLCSPGNLFDIFDKIRKRPLNSHKVKWLLVLQGSKSQAEAILRLQANIYEGTRVILLTKINRDYFNFYDTRPDVSGLTRFHYRGRWTTKNDDNKKLLLNLTTSDDKDLYTDMRGRKLAVSAIESWPFLGLPKVSFNGTLSPPTGMEARILDALGLALNFTYEIVVPEDKKWGNPQPDGTVTGLMGMIARGEAHLAFPVITDMRAKLIDYSLPFYREPLAIFSRAALEKNRAIAIFSPFTTLVWISLIISTLATGPILYILSNVIQSYDEDIEKWGLQQYSFSMYRILVIQSDSHDFRRWPQRLLTFSWSLFCLVVSALYSGTLTAVLAIPAYETPIDSLEDLPRAVEGGFTLGVMEDSSNELLFREADSGIYKQTWDLFNHEDRSQSFVNSPATGIKRVLERKFVYIGPTTYTESLATRLGRRKFHFGRSSFYPQGIVIGYFPGAPYKDIINDLLLRMVEGGMVNKWRDDEIMTSSSLGNLAEGPPKTKAITLNHLQAAFFVMALGSVFATVVLLIENLVLYVPGTIKI